MSDGEHHVTRSEFKLNNKHVDDQMKEYRSGVADNKELINKLSKIIIGNGEGGIILKVNTLMMRNHWVDKGFWLVVTVLTNLFTLYLTGVLKL